MNIAQVRTFVTVVDHGSFSNAARAMHISQPAVTMQVQALEAEIGATLLDRKYRKVELTEAGRTLLPFARRMLDDVEGAREAVATLAESVTGRLHLAASTTPGQYILPRLLGAFLGANPEVGVSLRVMDTAEVVESVESGESSLGMTGAQIKGAKVHYEQLGTDELVMICPPHHPLAREKSVTLDQVVSEPFVMREEGSGTRQVTEEVLRTAGIDPDDLHIVTELGTGEAIVSAVEGGMGVAVVSAWVAHKALELATVARVPVANFPVSRPLFMVIPRRTLTRAAAAFLDHLRVTLG